MEIKELYRETGLDRAWWGDFPDPQNLLGDSFPVTSDLYKLMPVCARISLHIAGELPYISFSREKKVFGDFEYILLNQELLYLRVPDEVRMAVFFGNFIHQLGHFVYSRQDYADLSFTYDESAFVHLLEDRRVESKLVAAYPGYYDYLYAARKLVFVMALDGIGKDLRFQNLAGVRFTYVTARVLYPELFCYEEFVEKFRPHLSRLRQIDAILDEITDYASMPPREVVRIAKRLCLSCGADLKISEPMFNYFSRVMKNLPLEVEGKQVNVDIKVFDDLFQDLNRSLDIGESSQFIRESGTESGLKNPPEAIQKKVLEVDATPGNISFEVLAEAKAIAAKIRLNFLTFLSKMNKTCVIYEQDSGDLDEDELYQVSFNSHIFMEELPSPSAMLEVMILLDLSGSMVEMDKLQMQTTLVAGLALAFDRNPNIRFSIYGHRVNRGSLELTRFHEAGSRFQLQKLFSQEGMYTNADGLALEYALQKFQAGNQNRLIFMISDGRPTVSFGDKEPRAHVREMVRTAKRQGVDVLSIGISNFDQGDMYDEFIPYSGVEVSTKLVMWLRRKFSSIADGATF